jgi:hypothetical protein
MATRTVRLIAAALVCGTVAYVGARRRAATHVLPIWPNAVEVSVPHLQGSITLDGDTDDPGWKGPSLRTGPFVGADGTPVHPHTEARAVWGDGFLYMNLYAADEDIRALGSGPDSLDPREDFFHVVFTDRTTTRTFDFNPLGLVTDSIAARGNDAPPDRSWNGHVNVSHELDGTPNKPADHDEEWVLEVALPFESLGLEGKPGEKIGLSMSRCDTPRNGKKVCGSWGEAGAPKVLVLAPPRTTTTP